MLRRERRSGASTRTSRRSFALRITSGARGMRRGDAKNSDGRFGRLRKRWPRGIALLLSSALHLALLTAAARYAIRQPAVPALIQISLRSGGSAGDAPHSTAAANPPPADTPPSEARAPEPQRAWVQRHLQRHARARPAPIPNVARAVAQERTNTAESAVDGGGAAGTSQGTGGTAAGSGHSAGLGDGAGPDQRAYCVYCPEPYYPLVARARGWQGTVEVALSVLADGSVKGASLWRSSGHGILDEAAVAAARHSRFAPPSASGVAAPVSGRIEYRFQLVSGR